MAEQQEAKTARGVVSKAGDRGFSIGGDQYSTSQYVTVYPFELPPVGATVEVEYVDNVSAKTGRLYHNIRVVRVLAASTAAGPTSAPSSGD